MTYGRSPACQMKPRLQTIVGAVWLVASVILAPSPLRCNGL